MSSIIQKVNSSRYNLKEILSSEWITDELPDLSDQEINKLYSLTSANLSPFPGVAGACNFSVRHKFIPSYKLHIIYYNFPENGRKSSKVTRSACDKVENYYNEGYINNDDSLFIIINDTVSTSLEKSFEDLNIKLQGYYESSEIDENIQNEMKENNYHLDKKHFRNVHLFTVNNLTNNILKHRLVPKMTPIRKSEDINKILELCNSSINQLPIILKDDIISKIIRLAAGDICKIIRKDKSSGENIYY